MATENYSIKFGQQQLLIENPPGSGIFGAPCGITTLGRSITTNTSDVDLPPCDDPDAVTWLGIDPLSKRMTLTFSGTLADETLPIWDEWGMSEGADDAFRLIRWYRNIGAPNQGYWEGEAVLTEYAENSEGRGRWTVSGTIIFDGRPEWHSIPPAPGITTGVQLPGSPPLYDVPQVGVVYTAVAGVYTGSPALTYQWFADDVAIDGATAISYTPVANDDGKSLDVVETATNASGSINTKSATSQPVIPAP